MAPSSSGYITSAAPPFFQYALVTFRTSPLSGRRRWFESIRGYQYKIRVIVLSTILQISKEDDIPFINMEVEKFVPIPRIGEDVIVSKIHRRVIDVSYIYHKNTVIVHVTVEK